MATKAATRSYEPVLTITDEGLVLGRTVLARMGGTQGNPRLLVNEAEEHILTLLAIAYGHVIDRRVFDHVRRAAEQWNRKEPCLALIHLAYTGLQKTADERETSFRLLVAEQALSDGITPADLLKASNLDNASLGAAKAGYNLHEPRVPEGNPDGGQWTDNGSEAGRQKDPTRSLLVPANYTPVHELPFDAKAVIPPDGVPILDPDSPTKFLMAPPHADFHEVYNAGRAIKSLPLAEQYAEARAAIAQEGTYDFQRDVPRQKFYDSYVPAANYAVGVYMAGAGYSLETTKTFAELYALRHSSNYDAQDQLDWIERGWTDAVRGRWR